MKRLYSGLLLAALVACGENAAEKANRSALAPLIQEHFAVMTEMGDWARGEKNRSDRYVDVQQKYAGWQQEEDSIARAVRRIVPTKRYVCLIGVLQRSLEHHSGLLQTSTAYIGHALRASIALDQAKDYSNEASLNPYSSSFYFAQSKKALDESGDAIAQMKSAASAERRASYADMYVADTLRAAVREMHLLPVVPQPSFPVLDSAKADTFLVAHNDSVRPGCSDN
jgi:hypothetical protein